MTVEDLIDVLKRMPAAAHVRIVESGGIKVMTFRSKHNAAAIDAIHAIAHAHAKLPGFDVTRAKALAVQIDTVMAGVMTAECTVALCVQLLRTLGVADFADESRFSARN